MKNTLSLSAKALVWCSAVAAIFSFASGQACNCSCDPYVPQCDVVSAAFLNEGGTNANNYIISRPGSAPATWTIEHANRFSAASPTLITHVCLAASQATGTQTATIWLAGDAGGLPGGRFASQTFTLQPTSLMTSINHQLVAFAVPPTVNGVFWCGVEYNCTPFTPRQGTHTRTQGNSAVNLQGFGWYTYDNWQATFPTQLGYAGQAPLIRALSVEPGRQRVHVLPTSGHITDENGAQSFFDVVLDGLQAPTSTVYIHVASSNTNEITVSPGQLLFDQFNWRTPQRVTLTGVDDPFIDGNIMVQINMNVGPLTGDPCWINVPIPSVSATNLDNELTCGGGWIDRTPSGLGVRHPPPRFDHAMAYHAASRNTVVFGGEGPAGAKLGDTWLWNGSSWNNVLGPAPSARSEHAMAYDSRRSLVYLFGGETSAGVLSHELWQFDGATATWSVVPAFGPFPRKSAAMAYDESRDLLILFGGTDGSNLLNDTWAFNGAFWQPIFAPMPPGARADHSLVYDVMDRRVRIFGGDAGPSMTWGDSWSCDGLNWWLSIPHHPWGLAHHAASYDPTRFRMVVFGGTDSSFSHPYSGETWERGYQGWTLAMLGGAGAPPARHSHAMVYDTRRNVSVMFGGVDNGGNLLRDVWEYSRTGAPTSLVPPGGVMHAQLNSTVSITISALNAASYHWRFNGVLLPNGGPYSGVHTDTLTIGPLTLAHAGQYDCILSNPCGETISASTQLIVGCVADVDDGSLTGTPDGGVTIDDLIYFLYAFNLGLYPTCDIDDGTGTGTPDGGVTIEDLLYYLFRFDAGC